MEQMRGNLMKLYDSFRDCWHSFFVFLSEVYLLSSSMFCFVVTRFLKNSKFEG